MTMLDPKEHPNVTFLKVGDNYVVFKEGSLDPNKRYGKSDNVLYEMTVDEVEDHIATNPERAPKPPDPVVECDAFLKTSLPVEYRVQLGPSVSQALLHYQYGDYEAFTYLMDKLEEQVPEQLVPVVKQCRGFFGL